MTPINTHMKIVNENPEHEVLLRSSSGKILHDDSIITFILLHNTKLQYGHYKLYINLWKKILSVHSIIILSLYILYVFGWVNTTSRNFYMVQINALSFALLQLLT